MIKIMKEYMIDWLLQEILDENEPNEVLMLFKSAIYDCPYSTEIWLLYLNYSEIHNEEKDHINLFELAVKTAGYNLIDVIKC